jgi:lipoprotein-anchoring transpeptidase ErfK/SrfK
MIPVVLEVSHNQLCAVSPNINECWDITRGKPSTPTPLGTHEVLSITQSTKYPSNWLIEFKLTNNGVYAIHSWNTEIPIGQFSNGCVRMNPEDLEDLITSYLFNSITIN